MIWRIVILSAVLGMAAWGCGSPDAGAITPTERIDLWNGKDFSGWDFYLADETVEPTTVWSVGDGVIRCEGQPFGYIRTKASYTNYKLHVEWRWPDEPTNSGVFVHTLGENKIWPASIECQLKAGNAGDFVIFPGAGITVSGERYENDQKNLRAEKRGESSEKPAGEWNRYDITCRGDMIQAYVNGVLQIDGTSSMATSGQICLQSEGGPIEFREIYVEPLD